jgi:SAM-dependent methyltransferase
MTLNILKILGTLFTTSGDTDKFRLEPPLFRKLPEYVKPGQALDVGCGRGWFMSQLHSKGYQVWGIDVNETRISEASKWGTVTIGSADNLPFPDNSFNLVSCIGVLHHLDNPRQTIAQIERVLAGAGIFYLAEVVEDNPLHALLRKMFPYYDGDPVRAKFKRAQLKKQLEDNGFTVVAENTQGGNISWIFTLLVNRLNFLGHLSQLVFSLDKIIDKITGKYSCYYYAIARKNSR